FAAPPELRPEGPTRPRWRSWLEPVRARLRQLRPDQMDTAPRRSSILGAGLLAAVVALGTLFGLYLQGYLHARSAASARDDALQAAKVGMAHFATYHYKTFDADVASAEKYLTPGYRKTYADFQAKAVRATAL